MVHVAITLGAALFALLLITTLAVPTALRLAQPVVWRRGRQPYVPPAYEATSVGRSFEPLDLGPDPVRWPSEIPWPASARPDVPWPSQTWDDPHFGQHWKSHQSSAGTDGAYEAAQAARRQRSADQRQEDSAHRREVAARPTAASLAQTPQKRAQKPPRPAADTRARQEMREIRERATQLQAETTERLGKAATEGARAVASKVPSPAELEQLVAEIGLAGTVQAIMQRTGWDFKTAAQHLAKARRGR